MSHLSNPLSKHLQHLSGAIRNIVYRVLPQGVTSPQIIEHIGIRHTDDDYCSLSNVCEHGSLCYTSNDGPKCDCSHIDYNGDRCEHGLCMKYEFEIIEQL